MALLGVSRLAALSRARGATAAASTASSCPPALPPWAYVLASAPSGPLYVSLTDAAVSTPLPETRGPGFPVPVPPLEHADEPSAEAVADAVDRFYAAGAVDVGGAGEGDKGVVFAGRGEPLLRLDALLGTVGLVHEARHGVPFRVLTSGLFAPDVAVRLKEGGVDALTVALMSANPKQHAELMQPRDGRGHADVCAFVEAAATAGLTVECTVVERDGVDVSAARKLAEALGAAQFRARPYFP